MPELTYAQLIKKYIDNSAWQKENFPYSYKILLDGDPYGDTKNIAWNTLADMCAKSKVLGKEAIKCIKKDGREVEVASIFEEGGRRLKGVETATSGKIIDSKEVQFFAKCKVMYEEYSVLKKKYALEKEQEKKEGEK